MAEKDRFELVSPYKPTGDQPQMCIRDRVNYCGILSEGTLDSVPVFVRQIVEKVLAFSTISNLGLLVACAGVGKQETI